MDQYAGAGLLFYRHDLIKKGNGQLQVGYSARIRPLSFKENTSQPSVSTAPAPHRRGYPTKACTAERGGGGSPRDKSLPISPPESREPMNSPQANDLDCVLLDLSDAELARPAEACPAERGGGVPRAINPFQSRLPSPASTRAAGPLICHLWDLSDAELLLTFKVRDLKRVAAAQPISRRNY